MVITPLFMAISWTSTLSAISAAPPVSRSGAGPLFWMVRYPPPILAPPGVARLQACVITRSPALTSSARSGLARTFAIRKAHVAARATDINPGCVIGIALVLLLLFVLVHEVSGGMQRAEQPDDGENCKPERDLDGAVARELTERIRLSHGGGWQREPRRQPEAVDGRECQHECEDDEFEDQDLPVFGDQEAVKRTDQDPGIDDAAQHEDRDAEHAQRRKPARRVLRQHSPRHGRNLADSCEQKHQRHEAADPGRRSKDVQRIG